MRNDVRSPLISAFLVSLISLVSLLVFSATPAFATSGPPTVEGASVTGVSTTGANIEAQVNPEGLPTDAYIEYGIQKEYHLRTGLVSAGSGNVDQGVRFALQELQPGTIYFFRVVASNQSGGVTGEEAEESFTTRPAPGTAPGWMVTAESVPTHMTPGERGEIDAEVYNVGAAASMPGATVTDTLPRGLTAISQEEWTCSTGQPVTCSEPLQPVRAGTETQQGYFAGIVKGKVEQLRGYELEVSAEPGASGSGVNSVVVSGGGATEPASTTDPVAFGSTSAGFGVEGWDGWFSNRNGTLDTQAGSHPYEATFRLDLNTRRAPKTNEEEEGEWDPSPTGGEMRSAEAVLPPGFVGDPTAVPQCARTQFDAEKCPAFTQIGIDSVRLEGFGTHAFVLPIYNLVPPAGTPAQFGFTIYGTQAFMDAEVRSGGDFGITENIDNIPQQAIISNDVTIWGVPSEPSHDSERAGAGCPNGCASSAPPVPLLTLPTSCEGPLTTVTHLTAWQNPSMSEASFLSRGPAGEPLAITGCERLGFEPSISVAPDTSYADTPAGLGVEERVPQPGLLAPEGISTADIKDTKVVLPEGLVINPGQAAGLAVCQPSQDGLGRLPNGEEDSGPASCPSASSVGTDEIETPLLKNKLRGDVYVLQSNPPNLKLLVTAYGEGVFLKLVGNVSLNEQTGRLTTTFDETPALPFTDFKLSFSGGAQAALATPTGCDVYSTSADFTPWATPSLPDWSESSSFQIGSGTGGAACPDSPLPFAPELIAGSTTDQAGGFTSFSLLLRRGDGQQRIERLQFKAPPGLSGTLSAVQLCQEPQASKGECPEASKIGHAAVASGPGPYPLTIPQPGNPESPIYITGPYDGAPFGLSIVTHVIAGPFNLGTIVTRAKIEVNPVTAQITVTTDPFPQIVGGVPTDLRLIDSVIDRPGFMFNPTNCNPSSFSGTAWGTPPPGAGGPGASAPIESHFQVGSCRSLEFKPSFAVSTSGETSRADGASLHVDLTYPTGLFGQYANIAKVKVDLPKQLPSRLTTLQKACTEQTFAANPASCPANSVVGHAKAITPLVPVPLEGPAYFVSHGGAKFPELIIVLQGYGITLDLHGETYIDKNGITSSTFATVPDAPVGSFELTLPQGPDSALAANGNLCESTLTMPTEFVAQNGAEIHESTPINVSGCKAAVTVLGHSVKGAHASIRVTVPSAGTLVATGGDVGRSVRRAAKAGTVTIGVTLTGHDRRVLAKNPHQRVNTKVKLSFTPEHGAPLTAYVRLLLG